MNLVKEYVNKRKGSYFISVLLAIVGVVAGLFSYIYMAKIIVNLINGANDMSLYTQQWNYSYVDQWQLTFQTFPYNEHS